MSENYLLLLWIEYWRTCRSIQNTFLAFYALQTSNFVYLFFITVLDIFVGLSTLIVRVSLFGHVFRIVQYCTIWKTSRRVHRIISKWNREWIEFLMSASGCIRESIVTSFINSHRFHKVERRRRMIANEIIALRLVCSVVHDYSHVANYFS